MARGVKAKGKRGRPRPTPEQKAKRADLKVQRDHAALVRQVFERAGFKRHAGVSEREVTFAPHVTTDLDHVFTYENLIVVVECTTSAPNRVGPHLRKKKDDFAQIAQGPDQALQALTALDLDFANHVAVMAHPSQILWAFVYASRYPFDDDRQSMAPGVTFLGYRELRYFKAVTDAVHASARPELLHFLSIDTSRLANGGGVAAQGRTSAGARHATVLPEAHSGFPPGFKVVTFYASADELLQRAYVMRRQGWRDGDALYQRMVNAKKVDSIRAHLKADRGVFVNNIIVTLDPATKLLDEQGNTVDPSKKTVIEPIRLQLPGGINTVGLIDGQHRTFAYHVREPDDTKIAGMRMQQNLLVTGIIFPPKMAEEERQRFSAQLFLDINSTPTRLRSDLLQPLRRVVTPFTDESLAFSVLERLNAGSGPLKGLLALDMLDDAAGKLKTASIVSYGLKPLVKISGDDSLFAAWNHEGRDAMVRKEDAAARDAYVAFCAAEIDKLLIAVCWTLPRGSWAVATRNDSKGLLNTTTVNALLILLRKIVEAGLLGSVDDYRARLVDLSPQGFHAKSSQYNRVALALFKACFAPDPSVADDAA